MSDNEKKTEESERECPGARPSIWEWVGMYTTKGEGVGPPPGFSWY